MVQEKYEDLYNRLFLHHLMIIRIRYILFSLLLLLIDIISKVLIVRNLNIYESVSLNSFLNLVYFYNKGIIFGFLSQWIENNQWIIFIITIILIIFSIFEILKTKKKSDLLNLSHIMIVFGAIGNFLDRIFYGMVIDFIDFHIGKYHWPIFNIADIIICIGIFLFLFQNFYNNSNN